MILEYLVTAFLPKLYISLVCQRCFAVLVRKPNPLFVLLMDNGCWSFLTVSYQVILSIPKYYFTPMPDLFGFPEAILAFHLG